MTTNLNGTFAAVQAASRELALLSDDTINQILNAVADAAIAETPFILSENEKDLARMDKSNPKYDRLKLTEERLKGIGAECDRRKIQRSALTGFLKTLKTTQAPIAGFTPQLWNALVEKAAVNADGSMVFTFRNGIEIKQKP